MRAKTKLLRECILDELRLHASVSTWHFNDFFDDCVEIMGWNEHDIIGNTNRLRYHLNKMVDDGILEKHKMGTGHFGKFDFGFCHSNFYILRR